ncbi:sugar transferase [Paenibacillus sp. D2_2]|uniref:sugar transferase n=1 Tax=Paenibacillus sp. D2_2 TaxID=3073092 RepID=UPI00281578D1|nr:sugar transferase [Paenibacillus sp. D2_2]WMT42374.1 sugar transferase [Paenibacillus sp. D2_2]
MYRYVKRGFDIVGAAIMLCLLAPVMGVVALLIRMKLGSPIMFKQQRPGRGEKSFSIYKFRTMAEIYDAQGQLLPDDRRYVQFGNLIRKLSLDELPQLVNVLKGEMSLIGPRPLLVDYSPYYSERERIRFTVRPGITGLAQVSGRNLISWNERLSYDITYVENLSFRLDTLILCKTVLKVIRQEDVIANPGQHNLPLDAYRLNNREESA